MPVARGLSSAAPAAGASSASESSREGASSKEDSSLEGHCVEGVEKGVESFSGARPAARRIAVSLSGEWRPPALLSTSAQPSWPPATAASSAVSSHPERMAFGSAQGLSRMAPRPSHSRTSTAAAFPSPAASCRRLSASRQVRMAPERRSSSASSRRPRLTATASGLPWGVRRPTAGGSAWTEAQALSRLHSSPSRGTCSWEERSLPLASCGHESSQRQPLRTSQGPPLLRAPGPAPRESPAALWQHAGPANCHSPRRPASDGKKNAACCDAAAASAAPGIARVFARAGPSTQRGAAPHPGTARGP
mmetsp:Transcript_835/g.2855  ORF Transcript_835/g.2855 Transcript_835/m.2855 type:complete len:306 (-) Transcript_835:21-938(-)